MDRGRRNGRRRQKLNGLVRSLLTFKGSGSTESFVCGGGGGIYPGLYLVGIRKRQKLKGKLVQSGTN